MEVAIWVEEPRPPGTQPHVILGHQQNLDKADGGCGENITDAVSGSWGGGVVICHCSASLRKAKALLSSLVGTRHLVQVPGFQTDQNRAGLSPSSQNFLL